MVWERIEQKFREREDARIREQQEAAQRESARRQEQVRFQKENEAKAEQERNNRCEHAKRLMEESRIISHLEAIKNKVIGARKDLIIDLDEAKVILAWGRYHLTAKGELVYSSFTRVKDYSYIEVKFRLGNETLEINGHELSSEQWRNQNDTVTDALADAYLSPRRVKTSEKVERSSYTGGSSSGECCHS